MKINPEKHKRALILLAFAAFVSIGLPDGLLGIAWPSIRVDFSRPLDSLGILLVASMTGYLVSSFFCGPLIRRIGIGGVLVASCLATGTALAGYTLVPHWWMMVPLAVLAGLGAGAIDAGINAYIAIQYGNPVLQWLHASWGIGATAGPIIMTAGITWLNSWRFGYAMVGTAQIALAAGFAVTISLWRQTAVSARPGSDRDPVDPSASFIDTLRQPRVWLSIFLFFFYCGAEMILGAWAYTFLTASRGVDPKMAGLIAGSYWAMFTASRIMAGVYTRRGNTTSLIRGSLLASLGGAMLLSFNFSELFSALGVVIIGFAIAPLYPAFVSETSCRVGPRHTTNTMGMQTGVAGVGGALLPGLAGILARRISLEVIPFFLIILFLVLIVLHAKSIRPQFLSA